MKLDYVTLIIHISLENVEIPDGPTSKEQWEAIYDAAAKARPDLAYDLRKTGVIIDCSEPDLIE